MTDRELLSTKQQLGLDVFALQIQDGCFPSDPAEDWGRGSPYSFGAERFFQFAARLGFDTIQLGPQGMTQRGNLSPYDGTLFSRNPLNLPLGRFVEIGRLSSATLATILVPPQSTPPTDDPHDRIVPALTEIIARADATDRVAARQFLADNEAWLIPDALYDALCVEHGAAWWREWHRTPQGLLDQRLYCPPAGSEAAAVRRLSDLRTQYSQQIEDFALVQWLLDMEHRALRTRLQPLGLSLYADLQVGMAPQDAWARQGLFLNDYRMGAPPSRTNPEGQPWGYAVFDPELLGTPTAAGPALEFVRARLRKTLTECDGVRIDHPHGWIDPWVYRADDPDPFHAVQNGARLFSSPQEPDHAELGSFAIARAEQIAPSQPRYADRRVLALDEAQVARYSLLVDVIVELGSRSGNAGAPVACEVLSTLPYPIQRVLERHGLGRFRVVQKAKLDDPADVYRIENSQPADWIMLGTHDTATIWELAERWCQGPEAARWGDYLSALHPMSALDPSPQPSERGTQPRSGDPGTLVHEIFSTMLASRARQVMVFFPDLFGMVDRYNQPGLVSQSNWRLRVPAEFERLYETRCHSNTALDIAKCFQRAREFQNPIPQS